MIRYATNSPTKIARIMTANGHKISQPTVHKHIQAIMADNQEYYYGLAKDTYKVTAEEEHIELNMLIEKTINALKECKPGAQMAMLLNSYVTLVQRRQYVMEDMSLYSSDKKWEKTYCEEPKLTA